MFAPSPDRHFYIADRQALTSLLCFLFGALLGRTGDRVGAKTRAWLCAGTFLQALLTAAAALCIWQSGQNSIGSDRGAPAWTNALSFVCVGLVSASLGLQGVMGKRVDTQFSATGTRAPSPSSLDARLTASIAQSCSPRPGAS